MMWISPLRRWAVAELSRRRLEAGQEDVMQAGGYDRTCDGLAEGCRSAHRPCSHQRLDPKSLCAQCGGLKGWQPIAAAPTDGRRILAVDDRRKELGAEVTWWHDGWCRPWLVNPDGTTRDPYWWPTRWVALNPAAAASFPPPTGELRLCPVPALYDRGECCGNDPCTRVRAGDLSAQLRDVVPIGPVNGMNERDPRGSYVRLVLMHGEIREERLISFGAVDVLQAELAGILAIRNASR